MNPTIKRERRDQAFVPESRLHWGYPPEERNLDEQDVHVWAAALDQAPENVFSFKETLSPDEQERAARFYFERDRNRFIAGRGILREILGSYLEISPSQLHFHYTALGKPLLGDRANCHRLHFNVGHSEDLILIAVTRACEVGIDVEWVRPIPDFENIVLQHFPEDEATELFALPKEQQMRAFFELWTRKEASVKATGEGLSNCAGWVDASDRTSATWTLVGLTPTAEHVATLAAPAAGATLFCWQWPCS